MATITAQLTLSAAAGQVSTNALNLSESDTLTVDASPMQGVSRIALEANSGSLTTLVASSAKTKLVYIKNTSLQTDGSTATTQAIEVSIGGNDVIRINAGEWAFVPVVASAVVAAKGNDTHTILAEFAFFTRS